MEENLNEDETNPDEFEEKTYYFTSENPLTRYCFSFMEYIRSVNPDIFAKASDYATDIVGIKITDFDIDDLDDELEEIEEENADTQNDDSEEEEEEEGEDYGSNFYSN